MTQLITVRFFNARLKGFELGEKEYEYASKDNTIEEDEVVLAGAYQSPAVVTKVKSTNADDVPTTHTNKKTNKETLLIQPTGMNVDIYAKTLSEAIKN